MISITTSSSTGENLNNQIDRFARRLAATPPGICPVVVAAQVLRASAAQTCGKCVPCRDGLPYLATIVEKIAQCEADSNALDEAKALAKVILDSSDCAIGFEAAKTFLESVEEFADEYQNHLEKKQCLEGIGQTIPCETLCPAHVDIPGYIACIAAGNYADAIAVIRQDNPFPTVCAFVCEHPCENRCRRQLIDFPLNIRGLKKFAVDQCHANNVATPQASVATGKKIAVIGAGPSGLTCAYYLALMGHEVKIFESKDKLGGMLRYGIPMYRLPQDRLDEDINAILGTGNITVETGVYVDTQKMQQIANEYDAVYLAIGAHAGKGLKFADTTKEGIFAAVDMLREQGAGNLPDYTGKDVIVVGGGNVAMDCARSSIRAGAKSVCIVYRRTVADMPALPDEIESAIAEGVEIMTLEAPIDVDLNENDAFKALVTQPQMIGAIKNGRPAPKNADAPQKHIPGDILLIATGQDIVSAPFEEFGLEANRGCFKADEHLETAMEKIFVGGDCQTGPASAVMAIGAGKVAALNIDEFLGYHHTLPNDAQIPDASAATPDLTPMGRVAITERPVRERTKDRLGVEVEMTLEAAKQECSRCLRCDLYGIGSAEGGRVKNA